MFEHLHSYIVLKVKKLEDVGVTAMRVHGNRHYDEALAGKYQFGMLQTACSEVLCNIYAQYLCHLNLLWCHHGESFFSLKTSQ